MGLISQFARKARGEAAREGEIVPTTTPGTKPGLLERLTGGAIEDPFNGEGDAGNLIESLLSPFSQVTRSITDPITDVAKNPLTGVFDQILDPAKGVLSTDIRPPSALRENIAEAGVDPFGTGAATEAALTAADIQGEAAQAGITETRRQFDLTSELLGPFVSAGTGAVGSQEDLLGLNGPEAQRAAIAQLEGSPQFEALTRQGEEGILQNASATGGLRGGNVQGALAQFRPNMLNQLIESQFSKLGGLTNVGQSSAARTGAAGQQTGTNIARLLEQQGAAQAGGVLAAGSEGQRNFQNLLGVGNVLTSF